MLKLVAMSKVKVGDTVVNDYGDRLKVEAVSASKSLTIVHVKSEYGLSRPLWGDNETTLWVERD